MARARNLKPGFFKNDQLADIDPLGRLLFAGLWCIADREGRFEDRPRRIKAELLPYDDCDINSLLDELHRAGFIQRYEVDNLRYIQVVKFSEHQNPHKAEAKSIIPEPNEHSTSTVQEQETHTTNRADSLFSDSLNPILVSNETCSANAEPPADSKKVKPAKKFSDDDMEIAKGIWQAIQTMHPKHKPPNLKKWAGEISLIRERDRRTSQEIRDLFAWANADPFWRTNILSPAKLCKQWDQLVIQRSQRDQQHVKANTNIRRSGADILAEGCAGAFEPD